MMGRKKLHDSVLEMELTLLKLNGLSHEEAFNLAWKAAEKAEEERRTWRRKENAWYQEQYREKVKWRSESPMKTVTLYLPENMLAVLDRDAREWQKATHNTFPLARWRSVVIAELLEQLAEKHKEADRAKEKNISASQMYIQNRRKGGVPDAEIQREIDSIGINMTIDEVLNYQFG